jgi:hypothetical protein
MVWDGMGWGGVGWGGGVGWRVTSSICRAATLLVRELLGAVASSVVYTACPAFMAADRPTFAPRLRPALLAARTCTAPSSEAVSTSRPSGEMTTARTAAVWPRSAMRLAPPACCSAAVRDSRWRTAGGGAAPAGARGRAWSSLQAAYSLWNHSCVGWGRGRSEEVIGACSGGGPWGPAGAGSWAGCRWQLSAGDNTPAETPAADGAQEDCAPTFFCGKGLNTQQRLQQGCAAYDPGARHVPTLDAALPAAAAAIVRSTSCRRIIGSSERDMQAGTLIWNACSTSFTRASCPEACRYLWGKAAIRRHVAGGGLSVEGGRGSTAREAVVPQQKGRVGGGPGPLARPHL